MSGFCLCGCGEATRLAPVNDKSKGWVKGEPVKFVKGHHLRSFGAGSSSQNWKGGRYLSTHGYVLLTTPNGRQYEHAVIAEKALGRKLRFIRVGHPDNEVVHHINGDKQDNRQANLLICTNSYHLELHHRLETSPDWPEFQKVVRNTKEKTHDRNNRTRL